MAWVHLDDQMAFNPKVVEAGNEAIGARDRMMCWTSAHKLDGRIPRAVALLVTCSENLLARMVAARLLDPIEGSDDLHVHGFLEWNSSAAEVEKRRRKITASRSIAGKKSGESRRTNREQTANKMFSKVRTSAEQSHEQNTNKNEPSPSPSPSSSDLLRRSSSGVGGGGGGALPESHHEPSSGVGLVAARPTEPEVADEIDPALPGVTPTDRIVCELLRVRRLRASPDVVRQEAKRWATMAEGQSGGRYEFAPHVENAVNVLTLRLEDSDPPTNVRGIFGYVHAVAMGTWVKFAKRPPPGSGLGCAEAS